MLKWGQSGREVAVRTFPSEFFRRPPEGTSSGGAVYAAASRVERMVYRFQAITTANQ